MKTRNTPWDYNRRIVIRPQKVKLCDECCANMTYSDTYRCMACRNTSYVIVYEHEAADFRRDVAAAKEAKDVIEWELAAAIYGIDATEEQVDAFLALTELAREQQFIGKWFAPAPSDAVSLEIDAQYGAATDPGPDFGSAAWFAGIDPEEF